MAKYVNDGATYDSATLLIGAFADKDWIAVDTTGGPDDGNVYVMRADLVLKGDRYGQRIERVLLDKEQNIDIDDDFDFFMAEQVLKRRNGRG